MKRKRISATILTLAMCFSMLPNPIVRLAATAEESNPVKLTKELIVTPQGQPNEIKLEAYVTGSITESSGNVPTDIVLVLDQSGSMDDAVAIDEDTSKAKLEIMRDAVETFTSEVQTLNVKDDNTYRVAIVGFASDDENTELLTANPIREYYDYYEYTEALDKNEEYYVKSGSSYDEIAWYDAYDGIFVNYDEGWYEVGTFGRGDWVNTGNTTIYNYGKPTASEYQNALVNCTKANVASGGIIDNAITALDGNGATRADLGMELAKGIFDAQPAGTYESRKKVVVFLTDGVPTTSNTFSETVANSAITYAKDMKDNGAYVFSLYFGTPSEESADFLKAVSSNYPDATSYTNLGAQAATTYYSAHTSSTEISKVFTDIIYSIASDVNLDEKAIVSDTLTEYFRLSDATESGEYNTDQIRVYTVDKTADGWADSEVLYEGANVKISDDGKTISVSGFNFSYYCVTDKPKVKDGTDYGKKLVIYIPIVADENADTYGGYLPTNVSAGIYEDEEKHVAKEEAAAAPGAVHDVDLNYVIENAEKWYHIETGNTYDFLYNAENINPILDEMIREGYIPDGSNNEGVKMVYKVYDTKNTSREENDKNDDVLIATLTVEPGQAIDVTDIKNWELKQDKSTITIPDGSLTQENMFVISCTLTCTDTVTPQSYMTYGLLDVEVSKDHDTHVVGGVGDAGVVLTVPDNAPGEMIENTYRETVKEGESSAVLTFTLKEGYEFSKIIVKTTSSAPLDEVSEYEAPFEEGTVEIADGVYTWQADNITGAEAVEVYTKLKTFELVTEEGENTTIESGTAYTYDAEDVIRAPFSANNGYEITSLTKGITKDTAVTYTADELLAKSEAELKNLGIEIVTADSYDAQGNAKKVIVSGVAEFARTDNSYAAVSADERTYKLTYKQYKEIVTDGVAASYEDLNEDLVSYVKYNESLTAAPAENGAQKALDGDNYTLNGWYKNHSETEFSGITDAASALMPASDLVLHAFWRKNPNIGLGAITVNKEATGTFSDSKEFTFAAAINEHLVGEATVKVSTEAPQASAELKILLSDLQNGLFENGAKIKIYEVNALRDASWLYDEAVYTLEYNESGNILKKGEETVTSADFLNAYNAFAVEYDLAGGTIGGQSTVAGKTVQWTDRNLTPTGTPSKEGHIFTGWKYNSIDVTPDTVYSALAGTYKTTKITLVAQYEYDENAEVNKYTVKYDLNGGKLNGSEAVESKLVKFTEAGLLPEGTPVRADYKFMGYKYGVTMVEPTTTYAALAKKDTVKEITLVAQWELDEKGEVNPTEPDGIEDKYQKTVTFKVLNGKWSDNTTQDKVYVVTLKDASGNNSETGKADISGIIPAGMIANPNYDMPGEWREVPPTEVTGTDSVVYTYLFHKTPDITYDEHKEPEPEPQIQEVADNTKIMVDPNGGIWTHKGTAYTEPQVLVVTDHINLEKPVRENYVFTGWTKTAGTGDIVWVFTANWEEDKIGEKEPESPDGVADKYQKKVYFEVLNGKWADNTTDKKLVVVTLLDDAGKYSVNGSAQLEAPTGMRANSGYDMPGAWREEPPAKVTGTDDETYTFVFHKTPDITYDEYDEPEPKPETEEVEENDYIKVDPNGGVWTFEGTAYTTVQKIKVADNIDLGIPVRENYKFMGWEKTEGSGDVVWVFTAQWAEDKIGKDDPEKPDDIADKYQKKVIFKVLNGTWSDGTAEDIVMVLDLFDENDKYSENGKAGLVAPTGMNANSGYDMPGAWREIPPAEVTGTETETFTYVFHKTPDVTYDKYEEPEPIPETEEFDEHEYILVKPNGGVWTFNGTAYTEEQKIEMLENIDLGTPVRDGHVFMGWEMTDGTGDIVKVFTAMWELDEKGTEEIEKPDGVADKYQKTVIFKVENGTWADGTAEPIEYVVDLKDADGKYSKDGKADISELIPMGMKRKIGYTGGAWNEEVPTEVTGSEAVTYTYSFVKNEGGGGGITPVKKYTLTYETNGGSEISKQSFASGTTVNLTKKPTKSGFAFEGWYLDAELTEYVTKVAMTKDITVYAAWVEDNGNAGNGHQTPGSLNSKEHFAYVIGYPDGTVKPENHIMRSEVTAIFFRLLTDDARNYNLSSENSFNDVQMGAWYNTAVSTMAKLGIIKGKEANIFDPNAYITRAEFAAICARFDDSEFEVVDHFTDVSGHWAEDEIHEAAAHGWIRGYSDTEFAPDALITRAEAMTMINRVLNRIPETAEDLNDDMIKWPDNADKDAWYYIAVQEATNSHTYKMKNHIYEKWTTVTDVKDWSMYQ